jgi:hypothetical protein
MTENIASAPDSIPDSEFLGCFNMPSGTTITGRASSIRNVFVAAIVSVIPAVSRNFLLISSQELREAARQR